MCEKIIGAERIESVARWFEGNIQLFDQDKRKALVESIEMMRAQSHIMESDPESTRAAAQGLYVILTGLLEHLREMSMEREQTH